MNISGSTHAFAILSSRQSGSVSPNGGELLPEKFDLSAANHSASASASARRESSSIEELELYFSEKIDSLEKRGHDTSNVISLRDAIRAAHEDKSPDSPNLPKVIEHPFGGKSLGNVHLSFGTEVTGDLKNLSAVLEPLNLLRINGDNVLSGFAQSRGFNMSLNESKGISTEDQAKDNAAIDRIKKQLEFEIRSTESFNIIRQESLIDERS